MQYNLIPWDANEMDKPPKSAMEVIEMNSL
jgi:hypothetical protein